MALLMDYPPVPEPGSGYWGPVTSTIDWCEENYVFSYYIAKMVNSLTNLIFVVLALQHLYSAIKNRHGWLYIFTSLGFGLVGFGSFLFHMSLRYEYQMMDELPMVYATAIPFGYFLGFDGTPKYKRLCAWGTVFSTLIFSYIYIYIRNPIFHQIFYAILNFGLIIRSLAAVHRCITDDRARKLLYKLLALASGLFLLGFVIWNIDNLFCSTMRYLRRDILGIPFGFLTEGHGWWHIFTGMGIYYFILYNEIVTKWVTGEQNNYTLVWTGPFAEFQLNPITEKKKK